MLQASTQTGEARSLGERRERWIQAQGFTSDSDAEKARQAYNQGAIDALHHQGNLQLQFRPRPGKLLGELITRPVALQTRGGA